MRLFAGIFVAAVLATVASPAALGQEVAAGAETVSKLANFAGAYKADDGSPVDLQVIFSTDSAGSIKQPKLQVLEGGKPKKISDICVQKVVIRPNGTKFWVWRCPPGVLPGTDGPSTLLRPEDSVVLEFKGNAILDAGPGLTVKLLKDPATIKSITESAYEDVRVGGLQ